MSDPATRRARGVDVFSTLGGSEEAGRGMVGFLEGRGALGSFAVSTLAGEIWSRSELSRRDRSLVVISFLGAFGRETELLAHVSGGLHHGLTREEIDEIWVQLAPYAGMPFALAGAGLTDRVFAQHDGSEGRAAPAAPAEPKADAQRRADGLDALRTLLGQPELDMEAAAAATIEQLGETGRLVLDFAFGEVWARPQLSRRDRSLVVLAVLSALSLLRELEVHLRGALSHGVSRSEIEEVFLTLVAYGGFPRAIDALHVARRLFAELDAA
jgi:4-carboxymuconolactone decarboxylase